MRFSIRTLGVSVAMVAVAFALLRYPTPVSATVVTTCSAIALLASMAFAIGAKNKTFWLGFLLVSLGARYLDSPKQFVFNPPLSLSNTLASVSREWIMPNAYATVGEPNSREFRLDDGKVRTHSRDDEGRLSTRSSMSIAGAEKKYGIDVNLLLAEPDTRSFALIFKELLMAVTGIVGGTLAYHSGKRGQRASEDTAG